jgi:Ca2+-binding EF-hand superfamily protein
MPVLKPSAVAVLFGATLATSALAQPGPDGEGGPGPMLAEMFGTLDADADGKVTLEELQAHRAAKFAAADANGDGLLDAAEALAFHQAEMAEMLERRAKMMIERHDDNGDGSLSAEEMGESRLEDRFALIDTDNDGAISPAEAEAAALRFAEHRGQRKHDHKGGMGGGMWDGWFQ